MTLKKTFKVILYGFLSIILLTAISVTLFLYTSPEFGSKSEKKRLEMIECSPNYSDGKFHNLEKTLLSAGIDWSSIPKYFQEGNTIPDWSIPVNKLRLVDLEENVDTLTRITWFGHSALLIEINGLKIFLDPMLGSVPAPHPLLGAKRFNDTLPLSIDQLPMLDAVVISHDHYDHLDYGSIVKLKNRVGAFYVPLGVGAHLRSWGVEDSKIKEMDWWDEEILGGVKFISTPARHFSGRGLSDGSSTLWSSWVIKGPNKSLFFGGDSGYDNSFSKIGAKYGPFNFAMLECGQYDKQWPDIHMMPEQTVQANVDLNSEVLMPIHWGAFKLGLHRWSEPIERALKKGEELNVVIATPRIGEVMVIGDKIPNSKWWINQRNTEKPVFIEK